MLTHVLGDVVTTPMINRPKVGAAMAPTMELVIAKRSESLVSSKMNAIAIVSSPNIKPENRNK